MSKLKDKTKRAYLSQKVNPRHRTILDPRVLKEVGNGHHQRPIQLSDYISVPAIDTFGTWRTLDLIPAEQLAALKRYTNGLARR